ncbi:MAG: GAF domain-containing protein [Candidatus Gastranaerophilales bacterium]|nr:GAF domain-containing protein [Candidatus Gastranaerophilales bacterium]
MKLTEKQYEEILEMGILLTIEKNHNCLFELIMENAMNITNCDGGTLYLYDEGELHFKIMRTVSLGIYRGGEGEVIDMPPVPLKEENVCAYSAIHEEIVNIADVYNSDKFDFSGPQRYDSLTGYRTKSMLVIPLRNHDGELIGVLQLINAMENGEIVPFDSGYEKVVMSLASQASISISNLRYLREIKDMMYSYVETMATIIDERTPYNGSHTKNVTKYAAGFVDFLNTEHEAGRFAEFFDENRKEQLVLAASLHDIGKMSIPLSIMNKSTKLGALIKDVLARYKLLKCYYKIDCYEGRISKEEYEQKCRYLESAEELVKNVDTLPNLPDELEPQVRELAEQVYVGADGEEIPYLTEDEAVCLLIKRGTLTPDERKIMQNHVVITSNILSKINFSTHYKNVPRWAGAHHEFLDGSGYPNHLTAEQMPTEIRILSLVDIFEALIAVDRPYKKPMSLEKAFEILFSMAEEGKLDKELVTIYQRYIEQLPRKQ